MSPPETAGLDAGGVVVVVVGAVGVVVVVVGAVVVVVGALGVPPPPPPPPPEPTTAPPALTVGSVVVGSVVVGTVAVGLVMGEVIVAHRFARPRKEAEVRLSTASVRTAYSSFPVDADAEASMLTIATSRQDEMPSVTILGIRCVVFAWKRFLSVPLCMRNKFAVSGHSTANESSKDAQLCLMCLQMHKTSHFYTPLGTEDFLA
jgi:hypothetical protein